MIPQDIVFVASDKAGLLTGQSLAVDRGFTAQWGARPPSAQTQRQVSGWQAQFGPQAQVAGVAGWAWGEA